MNKTFTVTVQHDPDSDDLILPFPEGLCEHLGWNINDKLNWENNDDGSFTLSKKEETEWVLVECVSTFRKRYMIEVPKGKSEWATDTVVMEEAKEFSQEHLGEQIVSYRVVTKEEALALSDDDNDYTAESWDEETKMKNFFTTWKEQNGN